MLTQSRVNYLCFNFDNGWQCPVSTSDRSVKERHHLHILLVISDTQQIVAEVGEPVHDDVAIHTCELAVSWAAMDVSCLALLRKDSSHLFHVFVSYLTWVPTASRYGAMTLVGENQADCRNGLQIRCTYDNLTRQL
eukprot:342024-Pleurochrysis_carterae.AAC.1